MSDFVATRSVLHVLEFNEAAAESNHSTHNGVWTFRCEFRTFMATISPLESCLAPPRCDAWDHWHPL